MIQATKLSLVEGAAMPKRRQAKRRQKEPKPTKPANEMTGRELMEWVFGKRGMKAVDAFLAEHDSKVKT